MTRAPAPAGYECLAEVLDAALMQAASGKGADRHAKGQPFAEQPMAKITAMVGLGFPLGQIQKKAQEAGGMAERGQTVEPIHELLGVINYAAGAILSLKARSAAQDDSTAPLAASRTIDARQPTPGVYGPKIGTWHPNGYTDLRDALIGPGGDTEDSTGLFPSGWTPEMEGKA